MPSAEPITIYKPSIFINTTYQKNQLYRRSNDYLTSTKLGYSSLATNPLNSLVIRDNASTLNLAISISPSIQSGHSAEPLVNSTKICDSRGSGIIELTNLDRGKPIFGIRIIGKEGNVITIAPSNNIFIHRDHSRP